MWELAGNDGLVIAGASSGIHTSHDRGQTWTRARVGLPAQSPGISFLIRPGLVLAGAQNVGVNPEVPRRLGRQAVGSNRGTLSLSKSRSNEATATPWSIAPAARKASANPTLADSIRLKAPNTCASSRIRTPCC